MTTLTWTYLCVKLKGDGIMVRLRRRSTDYGRALLLGHPAAVGGQRSHSVAGGRGSGSGAAALGINSEQLDYLRKLARTDSTETSGPKVGYALGLVFSKLLVLE